MKCLSVSLVLLAAGVAGGSGVSSRQPYQPFPTSSERCEDSPSSIPLLADPWDSRGPCRSLAQYLGRARASLAALPRANCLGISLEVMVRLARVCFVRVPDAPDPFASCQSLIRRLEKLGFSVTLGPRCCSPEI